MRLTASLFSIAVLLISGCRVPKPTMGFHEALHTGNVQEVQANLEWPESKFVTIGGPVDKTGRTPLHVAAELGHTELVICLIDNGAQVNDFGHWSCGCTPLQIAEKNKHAAVVKLLKDHGAKDYSLREGSYLSPRASKRPQPASRGGP